MLAITVRFRIKPGFERQFLERVCVQARTSLDAEPECRQFDVCRNAQNPSEVFLYEIYSTEADFDVHLRSAHFLAFDAATRAWIDRKDVERWERIENIE